MAYLADTVLPAPDSPLTMMDWFFSSLEGKGSGQLLAVAKLSPSRGSADKGLNLSKRILPSFKDNCEEHCQNSLPSLTGLHRIPSRRKKSSAKGLQMAHTLPTGCQEGRCSQLVMLSRPRWRQHPLNQFSMCVHTHTHILRVYICTFAGILWFCNRPILRHCKNSDFQQQGSSVFELSMPEDTVLNFLFMCMYHKRHAINHQTELALHVYQKWDKTAINYNKRNFGKTKWKVERRYSPSDINASVFIPWKQTAEWGTSNGEGSLSDL